jgi:hypothetical protein
MRTLKLLNQLDRGMTESQVRAILGDPAQKELKGGKTVFKYNLFKLFHGWKPAYVIFDENRQLFEWHVDEQEYQRHQKLWLDAWKLSQGGK